LQATEGDRASLPSLTSCVQRFMIVCRLHATLNAGCVQAASLHAVSDQSHGEPACIPNGTPALHDGWSVSPDTATRLAHRHDSDHSLHVMTTNQQPV